MNRHSQPQISLLLHYLPRPDWAGVWECGCVGDSVQRQIACLQLRASTSLHRYERSAILDWDLDDREQDWKQCGVGGSGFVVSHQSSLASYRRTLLPLHQAIHCPWPSTSQVHSHWPTLLYCWLYFSARFLPLHQGLFSSWVHPHW